MARWLADFPDQAINIARICDLDVLWSFNYPYLLASIRLSIMPEYKKRGNVEMALLNDE